MGLIVSMERGSVFSSIVGRAHVPQVQTHRQDCLALLKCYQPHICIPSPHQLDLVCLLWSCRSQWCLDNSLQDPLPAQHSVVCIVHSHVHLHLQVLLLGFLQVHFPPVTFLWAPSSFLILYSLAASKLSCWYSILAALSLSIPASLGHRASPAVNVSNQDPPLPAPLSYHGIMAGGKRPFRNAQAVRLLFLPVQVHQAGLQLIVLLNRLYDFLRL